MKKKIVLKNYGYRECDSFARYLEKMARKGWRFKGWRLGMIFYKVRPEKEVYDVEVFPQGDENDTRPEPNTEEYAQYCAEAGWELVDSTKKLCVFRKIRKEALPIVTEKERYENIRDAEWKVIRKQFWSACWLEAYFLFNLFTSFPHYIYSDFMLITFLLVNVCFVFQILQCLEFYAWKTKNSRSIAKGKAPFYGSRFPWLHGLKDNMWVIWALLAAGALGISLGDTFAAPMSFTLAGGVLFFLVFLAVIRPSRERNVLLQTSFILIFFVLVLAVFLGISGEKRNAQGENPPQIVRNAYGTGTMEQTDHISGFFGRADRYNIVLPFALDQEEEITCEVYQSSYRWVLERIYDLYTKDERELPPEGAVWEALEAGQSPEGKNLAVKYEDTVLYMIGKKDLSKDQILFLRQALNL